MAASCLPDALWKRKCGNENMEPAVTNPELSGRMVSDHGSAEDTPPPGAPHPLVEPYHNATPAVEDGPPPVVSEPEHIADYVIPRYPRREHVPPD